MQRLKILPEYFEPVIRNEKRFEIRSVEDRMFHTGETLILDEFHPEHGYTGRSAIIEITYVLFYDEFEGLASGYAAFSHNVIEVLEPCSQIRRR